MSNKPSPVSDKYVPEVRQQYEELPYPPRDPEQELKVFYTAINSCLDSLNHYHYEGKKDFTKDFNVLVAGGGTGDSIVTLAAQLHGTGAKLTYLDFSSASLAIARKRAEKRGLDKSVRWIHDSLLNIDAHTDEPYDYIQCTGVLHHLEDPNEGIKALAKVLKDDGLINLMVYAQYGRTSIYMLQEAMRIVNKNTPSMYDKISNCRSVIGHLPPTNQYKEYAKLHPDGHAMGDSGVYDLFLHTHDRAYTIPQLYDYLEQVDLVPSHMFFPKMGYGNDTFRLSKYMRDAGLKAHADTLSKKEQQTACEVLHAGITMHECYAAKSDRKEPSFDDADNVPLFTIRLKQDIYDNLRNMIKNMPENQPIGFQIEQFQVAVVKSEYTEYLVNEFDGFKSIKEIITAARKNIPAEKADVSDEVLIADLKALFDAFILYDLMFLKHKDVPNYRRIEEMHLIRG